MQPVPRIFVSATSRDLRTARGLVSEGLRRMECLPIVQDDFPPDYKSVRDMLRTKIATCDAVVHLAGFYYGAEAQPVIPGPDRRSFTQMEYEIAMELKKPCYVFLCGENFPFDKHDPEPEDKQQLQRDHRARLLQRDELFYEFASPEELSSRTRELQLSVENLREELAKERGRRRLTLMVAIAAVVIAIGGGVYLMGRQGEQAKVIASTNLKLEQQGALIEQLLAEQARLRKDGASDPQAIALQAEKNVAVANNQSVEDIRRTLNEAITEAQQAVAEARGGKTGLAAALRRVSEKSSKGKSPTGSNSDLAAALDRLAEAQLAAGHVNEAITAQAERFALLDRDKDPEAWAAAASNLALTMRNRDVMSVEPKKILSEALEWAKTNPDLGPDHPSTLLLTTGLARTLITEDTAESIAMNRHVFTVKNRTLGPDDPETIAAATVLARVLGISGTKNQSKKDTTESQQIFRNIVASAEKKTGPDSQETATALGELARALRNDNQPDESEALYQRALAIHQKTLGPDHENTLTALTKIAYLRADQGDFPGAITLARRVLAADEKKAGPEAKDTLVSSAILANLLASSDTPAGLDEAEKIQRHILETQIKTIGAAQPDTLESYAILAETLEKKGDKKGALKLKLERLAEQGKAVGADDTGYAGDLFVVASEIFVDHDPKDALPLAEKSLKIREAKLGEADPKTLDSMTLMVRISKSLGDAETAESLARRLVAIRENKTPDDAAALAEGYFTLVGVLTKFDRSSEALPFARKASAAAAEAWPSGGEDRDDIDAELAEIEKSAPRAEAPSPEDFASLRKEWKDKSEKGPWKKVRQDLPGHTDSHSLYRQGWTDGDTLMRLMEVDSTSDTDGTYTFTYWDEDGGLSSVVRIREGSATRTDGVKKIADTFNFSNGELVGWIEITDGEEVAVEPDEKRFTTAARTISSAAAKAAQAFITAQE